MTDPFADTDTVPPVITVISPTPETTPGEPGGFSVDFSTARLTPIVIRITDISTSPQYLNIVATYDNDVEEIVYRRGAFRNAYTVYSTVTPIDNGIELSILRDDGWPPGADPTLTGTIQFDIDVIDQAGNLTV